MKFQYRVNDEEDWNGIETDWNSVSGDYDKCLLAEECADHFHGYHDGWEYDWPLRIEIREADGYKAVGTFLVEMDMQPQFYASHKGEGE